jgi:RecA/RadA recombinase
MNLASETAEQLFRRAAFEPLCTGVAFIDSALPRLLAPASFLEINGPSGSGKTELLYKIAAACILPKMWRGVVLGGAERTCIVFDCDQKFSALRMLQIIHERLGEAFAVAQQELALDEEVDALCEESLSRLLIFRCSTPVQFLAAVLRLREMLASHNPAVVALDSFASFYWIDKRTPLHGRNNQQFFEVITKTLKTAALNSPAAFVFTNSLLHDKYSREQWQLPAKFRIVLSRDNASRTALVIAARQQTQQPAPPHRFAISDAGFVMTL